jgi:hypothetical protein
VELEESEAHLVGGPGIIGDRQRLVVVNSSGRDESGHTTAVGQNPLNCALA